MYIRALEQEVMRLKELFQAVCMERDSFKEDNARLREILASHGLSLDFSYNSPNSSSANAPRMFDDSSTGSYVPMTESTRFTSPPQTHPSVLSVSTPPTQPQLGNQSSTIPPLQTGLDYDQIGVDFVLA